jgi:16S rRNA (guanine527-N7)-methyltransferase
MDRAFHELLLRGAQELGLLLDDQAVGLLERYADRLLQWNRKVNLTSVTEPAELAEKHILDSLSLLRDVEPGTGSLLDIGSGGGFPGAAIACVRRDVTVTCCESVGKKVAFVKAVSAELDLQVRAVQARAAGNPEREGLPRADAVVSRALSAPEEWVPLGASYLKTGGKLFAMLGRAGDDEALSQLGAQHGLELDLVDRFELPVSGAQRAIARWGRVTVPRGT